MSEIQNSENTQRQQNTKPSARKKPQTQDDKLAQEQDGKYTKGEELSFIRVRFPGNAKSQPFLLGKRKFVYGQKVIAMSDRGMTVGYINSFPYTVEFDKSMLPIRTISKVATDEDVEEQKSFMLKEKEAEVLCKRLIEKYSLNMNVTHVEFIQFGKKAVFYFTAPERVDFRNLVKDLVSDLKMRIELRQISVRDRAAALGATGACGLQTCCSSFLTNYGNVSIKMAKNQNLALIPSKINGVCGQIKCCIKYEDDVYSQKRKSLPHEQMFIRAKNGDIGKVTKLHVLAEQFVMLTDKGYLRRYDKSQFDSKKSYPPKGWRFPNEFRSIVSEQSTVIGLQEKEDQELDRYGHAIPSDEKASVEMQVDSEGEGELEDVKLDKIKLDSEQSDNSKDARTPRKNNRNNNRSRNNNNRNRPKQEAKSGDRPNKPRNRNNRGPRKPGKAQDQRDGQRENQKPKQDS